MIFLIAKKYSNTVISQQDMMFPSRNDWENIENAVGYVPKTAAMGSYTKSGKTINKPHDVYSYDFDLDIPAEAYVTSLKFEVRMRCSKNFDVKAPNATFMSYDTTVKDSKTKTGWHNGAFRVSTTKKLSSSWDTYEYPIFEDNVQKYRDLISRLNSQVWGILFHFQDANSIGNVYIQWVRITVEYELPNPYVTYTTASVDSNNPTSLPINSFKQVMITVGNKSKANLGTQELDVKLPFGAEILGIWTNTNSGSFDETTNKWAVNIKGNSISELVINFIPRASGFKEMSVGNATIGDYPAYFWITSDGLTEYEGIQIVPRTLRRGEESCFDVYAQIQSNSANKTLVCTILQLVAADIINFEPNLELSSEGVAFGNYSYANSNKINVNVTVPTNEDIYVVFAICYYPRVSGDSTITVEDTVKDVNILPAYEKHILFNSEREKGEVDFEITANRIVSQVDGDLVVLPIKTDINDADWYVDKSTFKLNQWNRKKYIGCVEVPYSHYDPKNSYKDKLLDEHYKNDYYLGKENSVDETITLNIKLPKKKVPTIQGLIDIDRPIPINLIPNNWEGDPLNHRGWAEIYAVDIEQTNPLYYKCDIDVKYITHNIISRFNIFHGAALNNYNLPSVLENTLETGGDIGEYFDVTTDGTYLYDEDTNSTHRNLFSYANGQSVLLRSKNSLAGRSEFSVYWDSVLFSEFRENNITRVIKLVDDNDNVVFRYEYYDFDFSDSVYSCRVVGQVLTENGYNPIINKEVYIHSDVEFTTDESDEDFDDEAIDVYGSKVSFKLDSNVLTIIEEGFSGKEFEQTVNLLTGTYRLEIEVQNKNNDADTGNILSWFDFEISELTYDSKLSAYYNKLLVSPYPVPRKNIVFTRECAEGTIYYLENDGGDFHFLLEPFYQYHCGVDLRTSDGIQVFGFNNSYPVIYIDNMLVRFGINRLNGDLYLDKWDYHSKNYIRTNRFRISNFDNCEVNVINDDTITVTVSDIAVTMWRGRPYVMLQHENEDIQILDNFNQVFADGINDDVYSFPQYFKLMNSENLLSECVGGTNLIKSSCLTGEEVNPNLNDIGEFILVPDKDECYIGETITASFSLANLEDGEIVLIDNDIPIASNVGSQITTSFPTEGLHSIYAVYVGNSTNDFKISNRCDIQVNQNVNAGGGYVLTPLFADTLNYNEGIFNWRLTNNGNPVQGKTIVVYTPANTWHLLTNANGEVSGALNRNINAGKREIRAEVRENDELLVAPVPKIITISKTTPSINVTNLSFRKGGKATFRIVDNLNQPLENVTLDIDIGGTKYTRTTSSVSATTNGGYVSIKMSKEGTYTAKVTYAGEKDRYNSVSRTFTLEVTS